MPAPGVAMMAAADATTSLRVSTYVYDNDYRHPVVLAKEAATLDLLSGGRFELGLGAGWMQTEYEAAGIPFDTAGVRLARMIESFQILRRLLAGETVTFDGQHYQLKEFKNYPTPVQQPVPIMIGGGKRRILSLAAREAEVVAFNGSGPETTEASFVERVGWVREAAAGRTDGGPELSTTIFNVTVSDDRAAAAAAIAKEEELSVEQVLGSPMILVGNYEQMVEDMYARRARFGLSYFTVGEWNMDDFAPVVKALAGK